MCKKLAIEVVPTTFWIRVYVAEIFGKEEIYKDFTIDMPNELVDYLSSYTDDDDPIWSRIIDLCDTVVNFISYTDFDVYDDGWEHRSIVEVIVEDDNDFERFLDELEEYKNYLRQRLRELNDEVKEKLMKMKGGEEYTVKWDYSLFEGIEVNTPILKLIKNKIRNAVLNGVPDTIETEGFEVQPYEGTDFYVEGLQFGIEIEGNIEDLKKLAGFWKALGIKWDVCEDASLENYDDYAELKIYGTTTYENIVKTILFVKQNFRDFNSTCGIHVTINTGDVMHRGVEYRRIWLIKVMDKARRKYGHGVTYLRDRSSYSHWKHDYYSHYQVLRSKDNCVEYRAMGLPYLQSLDEKGLFYYLASIYALAIFLRSRWVTKEWWKVMRRYLKDDKPDTIYNAILFNEF